jgi:hypothetical protein
MCCNNCGKQGHKAAECSNQAQVAKGGGRGAKSAMGHVLARVAGAAQAAAAHVLPVIQAYNTNANMPVVQTSIELDGM